MNDFSLGRAWSKGWAFFSDEALGHALILIGMGIALPLAPQYLLLGGVTGMTNPAMLGQNALAPLAYAGFAVLLLSILGYVLQLGSYFASLRLGLARGQGIGGAIVYGLIAAVAAIALFVLIVFLMGMFVGFGISSGTPFMLIPLLIFLIPLLILFAALYTAAAALFSVMMALAFLIALAFGAGRAINPALGMTGGGGLVLLLAFLFILLLFWLTARLSCTTPAMADRGSFGLFAAMAQSWRMTADEQWRIMGYLALLGAVLCLLFVGVGMIVGAGMMGGMPGQAAASPDIGLGAIIASLVIAIPFAYLGVLVPAGIYRELYEDLSAEVFA